MRRSRSRRERGSAVVELALVMPILLFVILALVQVGVLGSDQLVVVQAARAGARQAAVDPDDAAAREAVLQAAASLDPDRLTVDIVRAGALGRPVTVTVGYTVPVRAPIAGWLFPGEVSLSAGATMRQEFG